MTTIDYNLRCSQCTGDLCGMELHGACPHCWADVSDTVAVALIDSATHTVADDVPCIECDYNLRTLRLAANCPECGLAVLESVRPDELRFADVKWLKRVRGGVTNLLLAIGSLFLYFVSLLVVSEFMPGLAANATTLIVSVALGFFGVAMVLTGIERASAIDPHPRTPRGVRISRRIAWWGCASLILWPIFSSVVPTRLGSGLFLGIGFVLLSIVFVLLMYSIVVSLCYCMRHVAKRGRRSGLRKATTVLMWSVGSLGALTVLFVIGIAIMPQPITTRVVGPGPYATTSATSPGAGPYSTTPVTSAAPGGRPVVTASSPSSVWTVLGCFIEFVYWIQVPVCLILGVVLLFMYRSLLSEAIEQASPQTEPRP